MTNYRMGLLTVLGLAISIMAEQAAAQQPAPAQQPAAPQPAQAIQPVYSPWNKLCVPEKPGAKPTCLTLIEARAPTGHFLGGVALVEQEGVPVRTLRVTLPLAMLNPKGVQLTFDQDKPIGGQYLTCLAAGCLADFDAKPELVEKLQKGQTLMVKAISLDGTLVSIPLPLAGFAKTNAGPPTDPKVIEAQQKKFRDTMKPAAPAPAPAQAPPPLSGN